MESRRAWERGGDSQGCWAWGELGSSGDGDAGASLLSPMRAAGQAFLWAAQGARPAILAAPQRGPSPSANALSMKQASPRRYRYAQVRDARDQRLAQEIGTALTPRTRNFVGPELKGV